MKSKWLKIMLAIAIALATMVGLSIWWVLSVFSNGYEVADGQIVYHTFDNVNWKVARTEVVGVDPEAFSALDRSGGQYGRDKSNVYFHEIQITDADPDSFRVLDYRKSYAIDANQAYWRSIPISHDPANFQILSRGYSKDTEHVYHTSRIVEGVDPATFVVPGNTTNIASGG